MPKVRCIGCGRGGVGRGRGRAKAPLPRFEGCARASAGCASPLAGFDRVLDSCRRRPAGCLLARWGCDEKQLPKRLIPRPRASPTCQRGLPVTFDFNNPPTTLCIHTPTNLRATPQTPSTASSNPPPSSRHPGSLCHPATRPAFSPSIACDAPPFRDHRPPPCRPSRPLPCRAPSRP